MQLLLLLLGRRDVPRDAPRLRTCDPALRDLLCLLPTWWRHGSNGRMAPRSRCCMDASHRERFAQYRGERASPRHAREQMCRATSALMRSRAHSTWRRPGWERVQDARLGRRWWSALLAPQRSIGGRLVPQLCAAHGHWPTSADVDQPRAKSGQHRAKDGKMCAKVSEDLPILTHILPNLVFSSPPRP